MTPALINSFINEKTHHKPVVSKALMGEAQNLVKLILKRAGERGFEIEPGHLIKDGHKVELWIHEKKRQVPHVKKNGELWGPKYDHIPDGHLVVRLRHSNSGIPKVYKHQARTPFEDRIDHILDGAQDDINYWLAAAEQRREWDRDREREAQAAFEYQKKVERLEFDLANWKRAGSIRDFVETMKLQKNCDPEYVSWALNYADSIDPLKNG